MTIALPTRKAKDATPRLVDFGGILSSTLGGPDQRLNRLGARWAVDYVLPPMKGEEARIWMARLNRAAREKGAYYFPQPGITFPTATTTINATAAANAEVVTFANGIYREGMFFSVIHSGKRYIYQIVSDGSTLVQICPPLRTPLTIGDVVALTDAKIEGYVKAEHVTWNIDDVKIYRFSFSITEAE